MRSLKIRVYRSGAANPATTCTVPAAVLKMAARLVPRAAMTALHEKGIELEEIVRLASDPAVQGTLLEVEDHDKGERVVISLD